MSKCTVEKLLGAQAHPGKRHAKYFRPTVGQSCYNCSAGPAINIGNISCAASVTCSCILPSKRKSFEQQNRLLVGVFRYSDSGCIHVRRPPLISLEKIYFVVRVPRTATPIVSRKKNLLSPKKFGSHHWSRTAFCKLCDNGILMRSHEKTIVPIGLKIFLGKLWIAWVYKMLSPCSIGALILRKIFRIWHIAQ